MLAIFLRTAPAPFPTSKNTYHNSFLGTILPKQISSPSVKPVASPGTPFTPLMNTPFRLCGGGWGVRIHLSDCTGDGKGGKSPPSPPPPLFVATTLYYYAMFSAINVYTSASAHSINMSPPPPPPPPPQQKILYQSLHLS